MCELAIAIGLASLMHATKIKVGQRLFSPFYAYILICVVATYIFFMPLPLVDEPDAATKFTMHFVKALCYLVGAAVISNTSLLFLAWRIERKNALT